MNTKKKKIINFLVLALLIVFCFGFRIGSAEAAKTTKWQRMLEQNGIDRSIWQRYLPKISRKEYNKIKKLAATQNTGGQTNQPSSSSLGPEISVGLWNFSKSDSFKIDANKAYNIKDKDGNLVGQVAAEAETRVTYDDNGKLKISGSISETITDDKVIFDATDGDNSSIIFDTDKPGSSYDHYRGKIEVNYYHGDDIYNGSSANVSQIWVVNVLPMEQYVWGMGETTGTGPSDHVRVMATIFRSYGYWYLKNATKYKPLGFKIRSDAGSQIYRGYDWEAKYSNIRQAADETRGQIVKYDGEVALTPYCSYTDGKTRALKGYPYLKSVKDHKKGKKKGLKPGQGGNHMWGVSAHGALGYAEDGKSWTWILQHYYTGVDIKGEY
jgi:YD repeat-containing protein